jgi:hypothetical protein
MLNSQTGDRVVAVEVKHRSTRWRLLEVEYDGWIGILFWGARLLMNDS